MTMPLKNALDPTIDHYCAKANGVHGLGQPTLGQTWALKHVWLKIGPKLGLSGEKPDAQPAPNMFYP